MLKLFSRDRYLAGNLCLVLFVAFLVTLAVTALPGPGYAQPDPLQFDAKYQGKSLSSDEGDPTEVPRSGAKLTLELEPLTPEEFDGIFEQLLFKVMVDGDVRQTVYVKDTVYSITYEVYGTVGSTTYYAYSIVYNFVASNYELGYGDKFVLAFAAGDALDTQYYLEVQPRPPSGGGGPAAAPVSEEAKPTSTPFGTVAWDEEAGKGTVQVNADLLADLAQQAKQAGQAAVDLRVSPPADVTLKTLTVEAPAQAVLAALNAGVGLLLGTPDTCVAFDPSKLPADLKAQFEAKPEAELSLSLTVLSEAEARQAVAMPADYRLAGPVAVLELAFDGKALPGTLTLSYAGATSARSGLLAALDVFGLFRGQKVAAVALDEDKLGLYRYNEATRTWEYIGGRVDKAADTVTAKVAALTLAKYAVMAYEKTFADLVGHWAKRDVEIMAARHIAGGVSETLFEPNGQVTRAQFAALLIRTLGITEAKPAAASFTDVAASDWYYGAVETARAAGLVGGYPDGSFRPEARITREEIAAMVYRALVYAGKRPVLAGPPETVLARFSDAGQIGGWAREALAAAVSANILRGRTADTVVPKGTATRAEATVMLKRALVSLGELNE